MVAETMLQHKCICKICQCGQHKCPHRHPMQSKEAFSNATEYKDRYVGHEAQRQNIIKPKNVPINSSEPLSDKTTHRTDFVPLPLVRQIPKKTAPSHVPEGKFEGKSVYSVDYTEKGISRASPIKPPPGERVLDKFFGEATYTADYKKWAASPQERYGPKYEYRKPSVEFGGQPIYTSDYINHGIVRPPNAVRPNAQPIQSGPFDAISTFTADYVPKHGDKQQPFRPKYEPVHSEEPFSSETTHRVDYTKWPLQEHFHHAAEEYRPNSSVFDGRTTYTVDYIQLEGEKAKLIKPVYEAPDLNREFSDITNYKKDYRKWSIKEPVRAFKGPPKYLPPEVPFDGQTIYQKEYFSKQREPCPVLMLHSNPDIVCEGEDECGHEFYSMRKKTKEKNVAVVATQ